MATAFITGATDGIGLAMAKQYAGGSETVVCVDSGDGKCSFAILERYLPGLTNNLVCKTLLEKFDALSA